MAKFILFLYNYFSQYRKILFGVLLLLIILFAFAASRVNFQEDISAFLPKEKNSERINYAYQHVGAANKLMVSISMTDTTTEPDADLMMETISYFVEQVQQADSLSLYIKKIDYQVDQQQILELSQYLVDNMPYFLTEEDFQRMDTILTEENIRLQLSNNKSMLLSPMSMVLKQHIMSDPLHLASPLLLRLKDFQINDQYRLYNDFIFSKDGKEGIVTIESNYAASETRGNTDLLKLIDKVIEKTQTNFQHKIKVHYFGSVDIAVTNASQIKKDSFLSISLSIILILSILIYAFRSVKSLVLIVGSLLFGWLFAMGLLSVLKDSVSLIAVGISSIIIGIAVNYPLHFLLHYKHERKVPNVIKDIVVPLTIGNITTIGAFLSLLFINSDAMQDLGLFASLLLAGTICFVLIFLPHFLNRRAKADKHIAMPEPAFRKFLSFSFTRNKWFILIFIGLTVLFFAFSFNTKFESNMQAINYMTDEQRSDLKKMIQSVDQGQQTVYYVSEGKTLDEALVSYEISKPKLDSLQATGIFSKVNGIGSYFPSKTMQGKRLERWKTFCEIKKELFLQVGKIGVELGYKPDAFNRFYDILNKEYQVQESDFFEPIDQTFAGNYIVKKDGRYMVMNILHTPLIELDSLEQHLSNINDNSFAFDAGSIGRTMVNSLSNDFSTVLYICGIIVFLFLFFTLGRIELSVLAFLPLTIGWFWILGLMNIFDIHFNIVNIILATLIFGQGDDYTIFMTEGLMYEYTYKRKVLASYKNSIMMSAIIMFVGIGSLIVARHPALRSLAEVTIVGMFSVVLMTFVFPPLIFRWLTLRKGEKRLMPITFSNFFSSIYAFLAFVLGTLVITIYGVFLFTLGEKTEKKMLNYHRLIRWFSDFVVHHIPHVKTIYNNSNGESFEKPAIIICNHQSHIDLMCIMMLTPKLVILTNDWVWNSFFYGRLIKYADFYPVSGGVENAMGKLQAMVDKGYSIMVFPEGSRSEDCSIQRFHRGVFYLAEQFNLDILPVLIHGVGHLLPKKEFMLRKGEIRIQVMPRVACKDLGETYAEQGKNMRKFYKEKYAKLATQVETAHYFADLVQHNYIYKGPLVERAVRSNLKKNKNYSELIASLQNSRRTLVINAGYGELPLLLSLVYKNMNITAMEADPDKLELAANCAWVKENLQYTDSVNKDTAFDAVVLLQPSKNQQEEWNKIPTNLHIVN